MTTKSSRKREECRTGEEKSKEDTLMKERQKQWKEIRKIHPEEENIITRKERQKRYSVGRKDKGGSSIGRKDERGTSIGRKDKRVSSIGRKDKRNNVE